MPLLALFLIAAAPDWVPARWQSADPASLDLVAQTPVNCVLVDKPSWSQSFMKAAASRGIAALAVVQPGPNAGTLAREAAGMGAAGIVLEGNITDADRDRLSGIKIPIVELTPRSGMRLNDPPLGIAGTYQGLWPGVRAQENGEAQSGPSGAPWIDTNAGFLRFVRASTHAVIWLANRPPEKTVIPVRRYLDAIADAEMNGARWVIALDGNFNRQLLAHDAKAVAGWKQIGAELAYYESHRQWRALPPHSKLAIIEDVQSGALLSGGVLDMIVVKHTPVIPVPPRELAGASLKKASMAVDVDPSALTPQESVNLKAFTHSGGTLLSGVSQWKFPPPEPGQITLNEKDVAKLDEIWKQVNNMIGRMNLGARLFNVSSMLSNLLDAGDGKSVVLQLVNYTDFPVDSITAHVLGNYKHARLYEPGMPPKDLDVYPVEEGTGVDIDKVDVSATVVLD